MLRKNQLKEAFGVSSLNRMVKTKKATTLGDVVAENSLHYAKELSCSLNL